MTYEKQVEYAVSHQIEKVFEQSNQYLILETILAGLFAKERIAIMQLSDNRWGVAIDGKNKRFNLYSDAIGYALDEYKNRLLAAKE